MWYFCLDFQKRIYLILYFFYWPPGWKRLQPWTCTNVLFLSYMQKEKAFSPLKQYWRNRAKIFPIQTVSDLSMVWLMISDFIRVPKQYTFSRNYTSKFEFQSFPRLAACGTIFSCDAGQCWWAQLPVSFMITNRRVNNPYTYSHSVFFFFFWDLSFSIWDFSSMTRDQTMSSALQVWSLNHWATKEIPRHSIFHFQGRIC